MWKTAVAAALAVLAGAAAAVWVARRWTPPGEPPVPEWTTLANGMQYRVQRVEGAKNVTIVCVYGVGSDHDRPGQAGLAHLAEHLYVTSAAGNVTARTAEEWLGRYQQLGSATTYPEITCISVAFSPGHLRDELKDSAARMSELRIEPSDLDRERPRVLEQIAEAEECDSGLLTVRRLARSRIRPVPSGGDGGGIAADVERLSIDDVRTFARRHYCPANARLAVAGDIDPDAVAELVDSIFSGLPSGEAPPAPPRIEPIAGALRIERGDAPGPGFEPSQGACVAYPFRRTDAADRAVLEALSSWPPVDETPLKLLMIPDEYAVVVVSARGDLSAEDVATMFDERVADFLQRGSGTAAAERMRHVLREYQKGVIELRKYGVDLPWEDPTDVDPRLRAYVAAHRLALPNSPFTHWPTFLAAVERLTKNDIRRSVAKWHVAERRVIVDWKGWRKTDTDEEPEPLPKREFIDEVRVTITWDEATQTVHRKIGDQEFADDSALEKAIKAAHAEWVEKGKPDVPVTISADNRASWKHVVEVMDMIKRCGIEKIEFAMGAPPKKDAPK